MLNVYLLGGFRLLYGKVAVTAVNTPRLQSLLAYLVLHRMATSLNNLGIIALAQGDSGAAGQLFAESLTLRRAVGDQRGMAHCLAGLAGVAWV